MPLPQPCSLVLLHTSPVHIKPFDKLLHEQQTEQQIDISARHVVQEVLLERARREGLTPAVSEMIQEAVLTLAHDGAKVVLCTCSTIGAAAEQANALTAATVIRVDRPMAERAVTFGSPIIVAATLASTLEPTTTLITDVAERLGRSVAMIELLCEAAWEKFEQGNQIGYLADIATHLRQVADRGKVIVLAQASMAEAARLCADLPIPILSSPTLGVEAALTACSQQQTGGSGGSGRGMASDLFRVAYDVIFSDTQYEIRPIDGYPVISNRLHLHPVNGRIGLKGSPRKPEMHVAKNRLELPTG